MNTLSYPNHVVPRLSVDDVILTESAIVSIKTEQLARPGTYIAKTFWDVIENLTDMLDILEASYPNAQESDRKHRSLLRLVEILMLRCTSLNDYLVKLLTACAPSDADGDRKQCCFAIAERLGRNIKVPINKTKHNGFTLAPIILTNGVASVPGFVVYGPLEDGISGPLSFSAKHGAGTPEGFSLPLFMRQVLTNIFAMSDLARDRLLKWQVIDAGQDASKVNNPNEDRVRSLKNVLDRLNAQPFHGFKGEHTTRSQKFYIKEGTLTMQSIPTRKMRGKVTIHFQIPSVHQGAKMQMPYWDKVM